MQIAVNAACLRRDMPADTGQVATEIISALCRQQPEHRFTFYFDGEIPAHLTFPANVTTVVLPLKGSKRWHRYWWREWQLPRAIKAGGAQWYIGLDGTLPLRSKIPALILLRDLSFLKDAGLQPAREQDSLKKNITRYLDKARQIAVLSATAKAELLHYAPGAANKVVQLEPAVSSTFRPLEWDDREAAKKAWSGGVEYFLVTGSIHPRNNLMPVFKAFSALKKRQRTNLKLVLAGSQTPAGSEIAKALESYKFRHDVVWKEQLTMDELAAAIGGAYALIYPTRFDGLPLPLYMAQQCKVPVIAMESLAAREAGGETVLYTDPASVDDLADKMSLLYKDEQLRSRLLAMEPPVRPGNSWDAAAAALGNALK
ncbi:glycosyltransferase family 4 protein [Chitinophaga qingshengii]|uniref:Glycosyltransferase family 4 protein n=1 Tax=Chitinophaga qingshengii TaxID=1569794 RepID=A0ABR7TTF4_9BACT|nr:glycosyltransferase family 1 protein [Chitinophaga qingshengii]MBC9933754.1 glycosyltransferase family 4 protein [Chitinophaga qingshengii]